MEDADQLLYRFISPKDTLIYGWFTNSASELSDLSDGVWNAHEKGRNLVNRAAVLAENKSVFERLDNVNNISWKESLRL